MNFVFLEKETSSPLSLPTPPWHQSLLHLCQPSQHFKQPIRQSWFTVLYLRYIEQLLHGAIQSA